MTEKIEELRQVRIQKLEQLRKDGVDPYPVESNRTHTVGEAIEKFEKLSETKEEVVLVGRIRSIRTHGKLTFGNLEDGSGAMQFLLREDVLGEKLFNEFAALFDMGDFIQVAGTLALSKTNEKTLEAKSYTLLSKSIRPVPQNYFGLKDLEVKLRKRYLDLIANKETRELFRKKAIFWQTVRNFFIDEGFLEVWNPVLENVPGGADAEPFITHHNKLDRDFYMRISLELPLKRLLVGGYEKVFEIGRLFRNEGIDRDHLQEYDDIEFYWAYGDHLKGMELVEKMIKSVVQQVAGTMETEYETNKINWGGAWPRLEYFDLFKNETGLDLNSASDEDLFAKAAELKLHVEKGTGRGRLIDQVYKKTVRPKLIQPCFLVGHPLETSPLAKKDPSNPKKILRFQPIAGGAELGNGFSELNDPLDQRARFEQQMQMKEAGDKEAQMLDEDYVEAMEYGMPPAVGFGMSERVFAVLMNRSIRETVIFPPMAEESKDKPNKSKSKETKIAVAVINSGINLERWQELNTVAHLNAAFGARVGRSLLFQDEITTNDNAHIKLNIHHAIMIKTAGSSAQLQTLVDAAREAKLEIAEFTREMIETTSDKKVIENTAQKNLDQIERLGVLVFGDRTEVDKLTGSFELYK